MTCNTIPFVSRLICKCFRQKFLDLFDEYMLFNSFILITLLHNALQKFRTFLCATRYIYIYTVSQKKFPPLYSTKMFTTLPLIVNLKRYACKIWTSSLKLVVILEQCCYPKTVRRIYKYSDIQKSLTLDKILISLVYRTLFYVNIYGSYKLIKKVWFFQQSFYRYSVTGLNPILTV